MVFTLFKRYITTYTSSPYNVYVVDLTNYPAGANGHPFGYNTICDMNGSNFADGLGEDSTFNITGEYKFDSTSCPPYVQNASPAVPNNFVLPAIGTECTNMCYTIIYDSLHKLPSADLPSYEPFAGGAAYTYQSSTSIMTSASALQMLLIVRLISTLQYARIFFSNGLHIHIISIAPNKTGLL